MNLPKPRLRKSMGSCSPTGCQPPKGQRQMSGVRSMRYRMTADAGHPNLPKTKVGQFLQSIKGGGMSKARVKKMK